jgi:hypothetical protein
MNTTPARAHIITHTHWDREWFLTSIYTTQWIPGLLRKLTQLVAANPQFRFLLDGQTLIIEDVLAAIPETRAAVETLVQHGHLIIGPYYCQPDWQLTAGELLIRNLLYGGADVRALGGEVPKTGWLVDTFGHIGQAPQIHRLASIDTVYVWRGVPRMTPYFRWAGSDGQEVLTINLFGGYRNLYGITHAPEIAVQRLQAEITKLRPYYPTPDMPLFDGYDLEDNPEDPVQFYTEHAAQVPPDITFQASTPEQFAQTVRQLDHTPPRIRGELNSGKYGATFPGTLSARTYLKIMARDCMTLLTRVCEPLAALAALKGRPYPAQEYGGHARALLQNAVHDCICGVSIDQVHEKMEFTYRRTFDALAADMRESLRAVLRRFAPGRYAVSTSPFPYTGWQIVGEQVVQVRTEGIGVWPVGDTHPVETPNTPAQGFEWTNEHYTARLHPDGTVQIGDAVLGRLVVFGEDGDTYSDELGTSGALITITQVPVIKQCSDVHCVMEYAGALTWEDVAITSTVRLTFDQSPLVHWAIDLDTHGTDFRVELVFETGQHGTIHAGMPFDVVERPVEDHDLLPRDLDPALAKVLLGQRELERVHTFPFHDMVGITDGTTSTVIFAQGIHAYRADAEGQIAITLRRAVEWLTRVDLSHRVGDAGPFFYVPDARCERHVCHKLAVAVGDCTPDSMTVQQLNAGFQTPPLLVDVAETHGTQTSWACWRADVPLSSLQWTHDRVLARVYNPTGVAVALGQSYPAVDVWGAGTGESVDTIASKAIVTLRLDIPADSGSEGADPVVTVLHPPQWRVGDNHGLPDGGMIEQLRARAGQLEAQVQRLEEQLQEATGRQRYVLEHRYYVLKRELYEYRLSARLNEIKLAHEGQLTEAYLYEPDPQVAEIGFRLNQLRIKRRIYDYIVESI